MLCTWLISTFSVSDMDKNVLGYGKYIYSRSSLKVWHVYIRKTLFITTQNISIYRGSCCQPHLLTGLRSIEQFRKYAALVCCIATNRVKKSLTELKKNVKQLRLPAFHYYPKGYFGELIPLSMFEEKFSVYKLSGRILSDNVIYLEKIGISLGVKLLFITWHFSLDKQLAINLTFSVLKILYKRHLHCSWGSLRVYASHNKGPLFCFCGQQPHFRLFPGFNRIAMQLVVYRYSSYNIDGFFTVIDFGLIRSMPYFGCYIPESLYPTRLILLSNIYFATFSVQVRKTHFIKIFIFFQISTFQVFDGPGVLSNSLMAHENVFSCSAFHCTVLVIHNTNILNAQLMNYASFIAKRGRFVVKRNNYTLSLPSNACLDKICILHIQADRNYHINATLESMIYLGQYSQTCVYGGLVIAEQLPNEYKEHQALCANKTGTSAPIRNSYSFQSSLTVILYWYKPYSVLNASLMLSTTKCSVVHICDCTYFALCEDTVDKNEMKCHAYLRQITRFSPNVSLGIWQKPKSDRNKFEIILVYSLTDNECFTMQILRNNTSYNSLKYFPTSNIFCQIRLNPKHIYQLGKTILTEVVAQFQPIESHSIGLKLAEKNIWRKDVLYFFGTQNDFQPNKGSKIKYEAAKASLNKTQTLYRLMKSQTPTRKKTFRLKLNLLMLSDSWVDITIHKKQGSKELQNQYFFEQFISNSGYHAEGIASLKTYCVLLKLDPNFHEKQRIKKFNSSFFIFLFSRLPKYSLHAIHFKSNFTFLKLKKYICLPGNTTAMYVSNHHFQSFSAFGKYNHLFDKFNFTAVWIDNYKNYSYFEEKSYTSCQLESDLMMQISICMNFSSLKKSEESYFVYANKEHGTLSWMDAHKLCNKIGAQLPDVLNQEELEEILAMFKLYDELSFEATYIGLRIKQVNILEK